MKVDLRTLVSLMRPREYVTLENGSRMCVMDRDGIEMVDLPVYLPINRTLYVEKRHLDYDVDDETALSISLDIQVRVLSERAELMA